MKRIGFDTLAVSMFVVLFGLIAAYGVRRFFTEEAMAQNGADHHLAAPQALLESLPLVPIPEDEAPALSGACKPIVAIPSGPQSPAPAVNDPDAVPLSTPSAAHCEPTLAPPRLEKSRATRTILYVQVEAEQTGKVKDR